MELVSYDIHNLLFYIHFMNCSYVFVYDTYIHLSYLQLTIIEINCGLTSLVEVEEW